MFTLTHFNFTEQNTRYFSNINQLAKDIKRFFVFLSNREKLIFDDIDKIKHTQLLQTISKCFGLEYYGDKPVNIIIDLDLLNKLFASITQYILKTTNIKEEFIVEVFQLLLLNLKYNPSNNSKSSILKKINLRIKYLQDFYDLNIYTATSRKITKKQKLVNDDLKKLISEDDYESYKSLLDDLKFDLGFYQPIISKNYKFVWYPFAFESYAYRFSFKQVEDLKDLLTKIKMYKYFIEIKQFLYDWVMASNINLFNNGNIEESYYIQNNKGYPYAELILANYEKSLSFHGGRKFGHMICGPSPLIALKHEHLKLKYSDNILLKKITWEDSDYLLTYIHTYQDVFYFSCDDNHISFGFEKPSNDRILITLYQFNNFINNIKSISHFGNKSYNTRYMKNFFIFGREEDYLEYQFFYDDNLIYTLQLRMSYALIKTPTEKITINYKDLYKEENFNISI